MERSMIDYKYILKILMNANSFSSFRYWIQLFNIMKLHTQTVPYWINDYTGNGISRFSLIHCY